MRSKLKFVLPLRLKAVGKRVSHFIPVVFVLLLLFSLIPFLFKHIWRDRKGTISKQKTTDTSSVQPSNPQYLSTQESTINVDDITRQIIEGEDGVTRYYIAGIGSPLLGDLIRGAFDADFQTLDDKERQLRIDLAKRIRLAQDACIVEQYHQISLYGVEYIHTHNAIEKIEDLAVQVILHDDEMQMEERNKFLLPYAEYIKEYKAQ